MRTEFRQNLKSANLYLKNVISNIKIANLTQKLNFYKLGEENE